MDVSSEGAQILAWGFLFSCESEDRNKKRKRGFLLLCQSISLYLNPVLTPRVICCAVRLSEVWVFHTFTCQSLRIRLPVRGWENHSRREGTWKERSSWYSSSFIHPPPSFHNRTKQNNSETWSASAKVIKAKESFVPEAESKQEGLIMNDS